MAGKFESLGLKARFRKFTQSKFGLILRSEAVVRKCSVEKVFLDISQSLHENTCARASFSIKLQALGLRSATLLKKRLWISCFPMNFAKFLRTPPFTELVRWLLL